MGRHCKYQTTTERNAAAAARRRLHRATTRLILQHHCVDRTRRNLSQCVSRAVQLSMVSSSATARASSRKVLNSVLPAALNLPAAGQALTKPRKQVHPETACISQFITEQWARWRDQDGSPDRELQISIVAKPK